MPLFLLGTCTATPAALRALAEARVSPSTLFAKHASGDWGPLDREDNQANIDAIAYGGRILSRYDLAGATVYVITEADRSSTTILLRNEY